jgi:hypothetical protein
MTDRELLELAAKAAGVAVGVAAPSDEVDEIYAFLMDKAKSELSRLQSQGTA